MSLKVVLAGLSAAALIAAPLSVLAQESPSAPIPYSDLAAKDAAMSAKPKPKHHHHKAKAEKKDDAAAAKPADKAADKAGH